MDEEILEFHATITYQRYYNEQTTYGVYGFATTDNIPFYLTEEGYDDRKLSVLTGKMQELTVGGEYLVRARTKEDKNYGQQYEPISVYAIVPKTTEQQLLFLKSIIPQSIAENLIEAYPNVVEDVVNGNIDTIDFSKVKGVRELTWRNVKEKIINNYLISDIITMLKPFGVTYAMIKKLLSEEPNPMLLKKEIDENPYTLTRMSGIGFARVDDFALKLKPEKIDSIERTVAFVKHFFVEMGDNEGHTWCSKDILVNAITNTIPECSHYTDWILNNSDFLHIEDDKIGLKYYHDIEMKIFNIILEKANTETKFPFSEDYINQIIKNSEHEQGFEFSEEQKEVIYNTLNRTVSIITGAAGTGKTSVIKPIISAYKSKNYTVVASALSAMAAQRITEASDYPAMTIHRTLGCQGMNQFLFNKDNPLITNVAFLDEGSMVNARLFLHWLEAIGDMTRIIISGDAKQLPPIGYGNVFSDLIDAFKVYKPEVVSELTKPMRQALKSGILVDANLIRNNKNPIAHLENKIVHGELKDMYYMFRTNRNSLFEIAIKTFLKSVETDGIDNVVIAVPRRKDCLNSAFEINKVIQEKLLGDIKEQIHGFEMTFKLGAKVMQTINDYDKNVFNGEVGYIVDISKDGKKEMCTVKFSYKDSSGNDMYKFVDYNKKELSALDLAYANTVHKLQGAGRNTVIGIIDNTHYTLLDNCMLYTLLTRAKKRCLLLAEPQALLQCIRTSHNRRNTWISEKIKETE